jgi:hypothetical protein
LEFADNLCLLVFEFKVYECDFDFQSFGGFADNRVFFFSDLILDVIKINVRIEFSFGLVSDVLANGLDYKLIPVDVASDIEEMNF